MASNAVALWQQVLKLLQDGASRDPEDISVYRSVISLHQQLRRNTALPQSVCKKLVQELQVCKDSPPMQLPLLLTGVAAPRCVLWKLRPFSMLSTFFYLFSNKHV
jgi:hypothetical protein